VCVRLGRFRPPLRRRPASDNSSDGTPVSSQQVRETRERHRDRRFEPRGHDRPGHPAAGRLDVKINIERPDAEAAREIFTK
jgi:hypothetical protein